MQRKLAILNMMFKAKLFLPPFLFFALVATACAHSQLSREPSSVLQAAPALGKVDRQVIALKDSAPKLSNDYSLLLEVYKSGDFAPDEHADVVILFGPPNATREESTSYKSFLEQTNFHGIFVVVMDDVGGKKVHNLFANSSFDEFCQNLFSRFQIMGWPSDVKSIVLMGYAWGDSIIAQIGQTSSSYVSKKLSALGLFDMDFNPKNFDGNFVKLVTSDPPMGQKIYLAYQHKSNADDPKADENFEKGVQNVNEEFEKIGVVENVFENITDPAVTSDNLLTTCLPKLLYALSRDPFVSFRCKSSSK